MTEIDLTAELGDESGYEPAAHINLSQDTPTRTRLAIPEEIKGYTWPTDINAFILKIYPNMRHYVAAKIPKHAVSSAHERDRLVDEIINNFVVYILGQAPSRDFELRWRLYDPVAYSQQPYYKWFLLQLNFFRRSKQRAMFLEASREYTLSETGYDETYGEAANKAVHIDSLSDTAEVSFDTIGSLAVAELGAYLEDLSTRYQNHTLCFEKNAYLLFKFRLEDLTNPEIAQRFKISPSAVAIWLKKLRPIIRAFMDGGATAANRVVYGV